MLNLWHTTKGWVAGTVAFVACPCHLPITLPLLIALTAGTAFGTWLENNTLTVGFISTVVFIGGVVLAFRWIGQSNVFQADTLEAQSIPSRKQINASSSSAPTLLPVVTLITSSACKSCQGAKTVWQQAQQQADFQFEEVDIASSKGRNLAVQHNIFSTPVTLVNNEVVIRGQPRLRDALAALNLK